MIKGIRQLGAMTLAIGLAVGAMAVQVIQQARATPTPSAGAAQPANPGTTGATPQTGDVTFAGEQGDIHLELRPDLSASTWVLVVSNKTEGASVVQFYLDVENSPGFSSCTAPVVLGTGNTTIKAGEKRGIPITVTSCSPGGGKGRLIIAGSTGLKNTLQVVLEPRESQSLAWAVGVSLALAVLVCLICGVVVFFNGHKPNDSMGQLSWDFSSSWASNITVFGTAFVFILQFTGFPDKPKFASRTEYLFVTAFAAALVALAPAIYRLISVGKVGASSTGPTVVTLGSVAGFLVACVFTIWGALLQTGLELLVLREFMETATLYDPIGVLVGICIALTGVALIAYSYITMLSSIAANATRTGAAQPRLAIFGTAAATSAEAAGRRLTAL